MRKYIKKMAGKLGFLVAIALSAVVGGISTGAVMASIPDGNGDLRTCYHTAEGDLRIIDSSAESCSVDETALNLTQTMTTGTSAFFRVRDGVVDTASLRNILSHHWHDGSNPNYSESYGYCLDLALDANIAIGNVVLRVNSPADAAMLDDICGSNFDALVITGPVPEWNGTLSAMIFK